MSTELLDKPTPTNKVMVSRGIGVSPVVPRPCRRPAVSDSKPITVQLFDNKPIINASYEADYADYRKLTSAIHAALHTTPMPSAAYFILACLEAARQATRLSQRNYDAGNRMTALTLANEASTYANKAAFFLGQPDS